MRGPHRNRRLSAYTVIRVEGSGQQGTAVIRVRYPDGSWRSAINLFELRDGRTSRLRAPFRETP